MRRDTSKEVTSNMFNILWHVVGPPSYLFLSFACLSARFRANQSNAVLYVSAKSGDREDLLTGFTVVVREGEMMRRELC